MKLNFVVSRLNVILILFSLLSCDSSENQYQDAEIILDGYVPNKLTAIKIAEAVWLPIYGDKIFNQKPFKANIIGDSIWVVTGSLKDGVDGGVASIKIKAKTGEVIEVSHSK